MGHQDCVITTNQGFAIPNNLSKSGNSGFGEKLKHRAIVLRMWDQKVRRIHAKE
jgi:hypothetical protein